MLNVLNGSYIMGYSDMSKKPFEPLTLVADGYEEVEKHVKGNPDLEKTANKTMDFLNGFYSDFALELLSSISYLAKEYKTFDQKLIVKHLASWSDRKRSMFSNPKYVDISLRQIQSHLA